MQNHRPCRQSLLMNTQTYLELLSLTLLKMVDHVDQLRVKFVQKVAKGFHISSNILIKLLQKMLR